MDVCRFPGEFPQATVGEASGQTCDVAWSRHILDTAGHTMSDFVSRRQYLSRTAALAALGASAAGSTLAPADADVQPQSDLAELPEGWKLNRVLVTPHGPDDGGDFGPRTPGTRTSGLQEALDAAKRQVKDVYICGGSWTTDVNQPVVYVLHETLRVPWMQDFRLESGHCVIHHAAKSGDAVVFDSQMSCAYRFGLIVTVSDGATVRFAPTTAGPDRFRVITSTDFHFNALVAGGGAWPSGEAYNSELNARHRWIGTGLWLDGTAGTIDGNRIIVNEIVGGERGIHLSGATTHNSVEATLVHLCQNHVQIGATDDPAPHDNRVQAHLESEGIKDAVGARLFGRDNALDLTFGRMAAGRDVVLETSAQGNLLQGMRFPHGITNRALVPTNRVIANTLASLPTETPGVPASGESVVNRNPFPVEVRITSAGGVTRWSETPPGGRPRAFDGAFHAGQTFTLNPGDSVALEYREPPAWVWKGIG